MKHKVNVFRHTNVQNRTLMKKNQGISEANDKCVPSYFLNEELAISPYSNGPLTYNLLLTDYS